MINDGNCFDRYVRLGSNRSKYSFVVPADGCGTEQKDGAQSNILIFQTDEIVQVNIFHIEFHLRRGWLASTTNVNTQEIWDTSRKIVCKMSDKITKYVTWSPLTVDMLDVQNAATTGGVDCWMDMLRGVYPNVSLFTVSHGCLSINRSQALCPGS